MIDPAFKSRIHFPIAYPKLSAAARCELWQNLIVRATGRRRPRWLNYAFLDQVSRNEINGRQIKNAVRVAAAVAANEKRQLAAQDIP